MSAQKYTTKGGQTLWRCDVWVDGKTITRRGFPNKREAAKVERGIRNLADKKMSPTSPRLTLGEYLEDWYAARLSFEPAIGQSQYKRIRQHLNNIIPVLGLIKLKELKTEDVLCLRKKLQYHLANRTIKQTEIILKGALKSGVKRNLMPVNPLEELATLRIDDIIDNKEIEIFEPDEQRRLIEAARSYAAENDLRDFIRPLIGLHTGARSGEMAGLQWKHVNFKEKTIRIEQSLEYGGGDTQGNLKSPKTKAGIRTISVTETLCKELEVYRLWVSEFYLQLGKRLTPNSFVLFDNDMGPLHRTAPEKRWETLLKRAKLKHRGIHHLRHTYASNLIAMGVSPKVIQVMLGHSTFAMTMDTYGHLFKQGVDEVHDALAAWEAKTFS